ncbi:hypothetical protein BHE74_00022120 [Ensete ventricosum]|nr:hypothetical protein BHE74_00022120 [Ensete ventricosum]
MCILGCSCLDVHPEMLLLGGSHEVLYESLVGVGGTQFTMLSSSSSNEKRNFGDCSPSESSSSMDERSSKALEAILREHDEDSVITISSLPKIRATYRPTWGSRGPRKGEGPREGAPRVEGGLKVARAKNQEMEEFLSVAQTVRKKAEKDLAVEFSVTPKKARVTIAQHKESPCFKSGLEKMGRVSYEFGYKIAVTHFQTKHLGLEVEENPYTTLLEDDDVLMEVPFDDNDPITMKEHRFVTNLVIF